MLCVKHHGGLKLHVYVRQSSQWLSSCTLSSEAPSLEALDMADTLVVLLVSCGVGRALTQHKFLPGLGPQGCAQDNGQSASL